MKFTLHKEFEVSDEFINELAYWIHVCMFDYNMSEEDIREKLFKQLQVSNRNICMRGHVDRGVTHVDD